jgi:hypothetical protein
MSDDFRDYEDCQKAIIDLLMNLTEGDSRISKNYTPREMDEELWTVRLTSINNVPTISITGPIPDDTIFQITSLTKKYKFAVSFEYENDEMDREPCSIGSKMTDIMGTENRENGRQFLEDWGVY